VHPDVLQSADKTDDIIHGALVFGTEYRIDPSSKFGYRLVRSLTAR